MSDPNPQARDAFGQLLDAMPRIAEAVNAFTSEDNQRAALDALVRAIGLPDRPSAPGVLPAEPLLSVVRPPEDDEAGDGEQDDAAGSGQDAHPEARQRRTRKVAAKKSWSRVKDVNFRPEGKQSLREFAKAKGPANFHEKNLVIVYYLEVHLEIVSVEVGHVLAAYDECGWRSPSNPDNSLAVTASKKHWLDTSDLKAIRTTHSGRNAVEFDMPTKAQKSA
jgi:hypothetical protein